MIIGTVKWFDAQKGYGFITANNKDYFAHFKEIQADGYKELKEGQKVSFIPEESPKGPIARALTKID